MISLMDRIATKKQRDKRRARRVFALSYLGDKCKVCETNRGLEFDHIDGSTKQRDISQMLDFSMTALVTELDKCQLLCKPCHMKKTIADRGYAIAANGSTGMYTNRGCRCTKCTAANTAYYRIYKRIYRS